MIEENEDYQIDTDYPKRGRVVSNLVGIVERDQNGDAWLSHGKVLIKSEDISRVV